MYLDEVKIANQFGLRFGLVLVSQRTHCKKNRMDHKLIILSQDVRRYNLGRSI